MEKDLSIPEANEVESNAPAESIKEFPITRPAIAAAFATVGEDLITLIQSVDDRGRICWLARGDVDAVLQRFADNFSIGIADFLLSLKECEGLIKATRRSRQ